MAPTPVSGTLDMISGMTPILHPEACVYATISSSIAQQELSQLIGQSHALFNEGEDGLSVLLDLSVAKQSQHVLSIEEPVMSHIELKVYSSLEGIGLTAAVADVLTVEKIPCNVVAALKHDHIYVPAEKADAAIAALRKLVDQAKGQKGAT